MLKLLKTREKPFPELSYANPRQPALTRWVIHSIEGLSGRDRYTALYDFWRRQVVPTGERVFSRMLELIDVRVRTADQWPPAQLPDTPLVIVANHPFGIGDGIAHTGRCGDRERGHDGGDAEGLQRACAGTRLAQGHCDP